MERVRVDSGEREPFGEGEQETIGGETKHGARERRRRVERGLVTKHVNHPKTSNKHCAPSNYKYVMHIL